MNTHPIPPAPELKDLASYLDKLPPMDLPQEGGLLYRWRCLSQEAGKR